MPARKTHEKLLDLPPVSARQAETQLHFVRRVSPREGEVRVLCVQNRRRADGHDAEKQPRVQAVYARNRKKGLRAVQPVSARPA